MTSATTSNGTTTVTVKAIRSSGATAWTATLPAGAHHLELSDGNLLAESSTRASDGTVTSTLTAISTASGATAWTKTFSGHIGEIAPFNGGTYLFVIVPPATSGGSAMRSLVAIDNNGNTRDGSPAGPAGAAAPLARDDAAAVLAAAVGEAGGTLSRMTAGHAMIRPHDFVSANSPHDPDRHHLVSHV